MIESIQKKELMPNLNLPFARLRTQKQKGKNCVFDILRKQYVRLTPEEWVRQSFICYLTNDKGYPRALLANEICIRQGRVVRRCDTILYNRWLLPQMIFEYKSPFVSLTSSCFEQVFRYNSTLKVSWIVVSNGLIHRCCRLMENGKYSLLREIPDYRDL